MYCTSESERRLVLPHKVDLSTGQSDLLAAKSMELKRFNHMSSDVRLPKGSVKRQSECLIVSQDVQFRF